MVLVLPVGLIQSCSVSCQLQASSSPECLPDGLLNPESPVPSYPYFG